MTSSSMPSSTRSSACVWEQKLIEFALDDDAVNVRYCAGQLDAATFRLKHANLLARVVERHGFCDTVLALAEHNLVLMHAWAPSGGWYDVLNTEEKVRWALEQSALARAGVPLCFVIAHAEHPADLLCEAVRRGFAAEIRTWSHPVHIIQLLATAQNWTSAAAVLPLLGPDRDGRLPLDHLSENYFRGRTMPLCREFHALWSAAFAAAAASPSYDMEGLLARFLQVDSLVLAPAVDQICRRICTRPLDYPTLFRKMEDATDAAYHRLMSLHPRREELIEHLAHTSWFRRRSTLDALFSE